MSTENSLKGPQRPFNNLKQYGEYIDHYAELFAKKTKNSQFDREELIRIATDPGLKKEWDVFVNEFHLPTESGVGTVGELYLQEAAKALNDAKRMNR